jgi:CubicO group peptidase (beta-lactamase class C family)
MYEFPKPDYFKEGSKTEVKDPTKKLVVTYSSINGNGYGDYGEVVMGDKGTLVLLKEQEVMLYKDADTKTSVGVVEGKGGKPALDTTLADWSAFLAAVVRGERLSAVATTEMIRRQIDIDSEVQFPTLSDARTDRWKSIGLGYGLGWGVFDTRHGRAFFKEGHDEGTANHALCIAGKRACILMMSNSVRAERIFATLVARLFGDVPLPYSWEGYAAPR